MRRVLAGLIAALLLVLVGCAGDGDGEATDSSTSSSTTSSVVAPGTSIEVGGPISLEGVAVRLQEEVEAENPVALAPRPGVPNLTVAELPGFLRQLSVENRTGADGAVTETTYRLERGNLLDVSGRVDQRNGVRGLAFASDGRKLYISYISTDPSVVVDEYQVTNNGLDVSSRTEIIRVGAPGGLQRGGALEFGRDGFLYLGTGVPDGQEAAAQDPASLLGKVLRLDPGGALRGEGYAIPPGNPFADDAGAGEVWALGVRDPRGLAFDRETGDLYLTDYRGGVDSLTYLSALQGPAGRGANIGYGGGTATVGPLLEVPRGDRCELRQGVVYRGTAIPGLEGAYVYGDRCSSAIRGALVGNNVLVDDRELGVALQPDGLGGFGVDNDGEVWVLATSGQIDRLLPV